MKIVTIRMLGNGNALLSEAYHYKTFFDVAIGDIVVVNTSTGYRLAKVVSNEVSKLVYRLVEDYLVQVVNDLPYRYYVEKDKKLQEVRDLLRDLSTEELEDLKEEITKMKNS